MNKITNVLIKIMIIYLFNMLKCLFFLVLATMSGKLFKTVKAEVLKCNKFPEKVKEILSTAVRINIIYLAIKIIVNLTLSFYN